MPAFLLMLFLTWDQLCNGQAVYISQWPRYISASSNTTAEMHCYQNNTDYQYMYWYQHRHSEGPKLIASFVAGRASYEQGFQSGYVVSSSENKKWSLKVQSMKEKDDAVYLCAASLYGGAGDPAYFGVGTKLTVLEPGIEITPPNVKVLPPSGQELCKTKSVTLVCVATRFYPDHINVIWQLNGKDAKNYVTDNRALWDDNNKTYSITSRLKVLSKQWFNTKNKFTCLTSFYNGEKNLENQDTIQGVEGGGMNIEYIKKSGLTAKLSYGVLLFKSFGYGLFVFAVVWKLRGSAKKRNN